MHHKADHIARAFGFLAIAASLLGVVACSAAEAPAEDPAEAEETPELPKQKKSATPAPPADPTPPADPAPTPAPPPQPAPTPEPDASAPPPTGNACSQLNPCCVKLTDQFARLGCIAIQQSGQVALCQAQLAFCSILP